MMQNYTSITIITLHFDGNENMTLTC